MWAREALERLLQYDEVDTVLDVGAGAGEHAALIRKAGKRAITISLQPPADYVGDYNTLYVAPEIDCFDAAWCSHVLEHQPNVQSFLQKLMNDVRPGGLLVITVPPPKHEIVGGHLTLWNQGLLLYNLVAAGLDCRDARVSPLYDDYNLSVIARNVKRPAQQLACDAGDIELLAEYFPFPVKQGFSGWNCSVNW